MMIMMMMMMIMMYVLQLLASLSYGLNYVFLRSLSWRLLYLELVNDVCGTYVSYYIAEYSFITDISPVEQRSAAHRFLKSPVGFDICAAVFRRRFSIYSVLIVKELVLGAFNQ